MKHIPPSRREPPKPPSEDVYYEVTVAAFNKEKGIWEEVSTDIGLKTASFIESQGNLELFRRAKPGDVLEFTEKGVYKKEGEISERAFTAEEAKRELPTIRKVMQTMSSNLQRVLKSDESIERSTYKEKPSKAFTNAIVVMQVKVIKGKLTESKAPDASYIAKVATHQPELSRRISEELKVESSGELANLMGAAKVVITPKYFAPAPTITRLDKGAVKEVLVKSNDPKHVFYMAMSNLFKSALGLSGESELLAEVKTVENIVSNLKRNELLKLLNENENADEILKIIEKKLGPKYITEMFALNPQQLVSKTGIKIDDAKEILALKDKLPREVGKNLMVDLKIVEDKEKIEGKLTVQAPRAIGNLEKEIREGDLSFENKESYCLGILSGMADMHDAGFVHGDLKLDNILIFQDTSVDPPIRYVKITDFGKTRVLQEDQKVMYMGNPRFAAYDGKLSKTGEMIGTALIMIRVLEEGLINDKTGTMLRTPEKTKTQPIPEERRGVERYVVTSESFPHVEGSTLEGKVRVLSQRIQPATGSNLKKAEEELHVYIDKLGIALKAKQGADPQKIDDYMALLKKMTHLEPKDRPLSMREAYNQFVAISSR